MRFYRCTVVVLQSGRKQMLRYGWTWTVGRVIAAHHANIPWPWHPWPTPTSEGLPRKLCVNLCNPCSCRFKRILVMQTAMDESDIPPKLTSLFIANQASTCRMAASVRGVKVWLLVRVVRSKSSATARHLPSPCFITPRNSREIAVMINING